MSYGVLRIAEQIYCCWQQSAAGHVSTHPSHPSMDLLGCSAGPAEGESWMAPGSCKVRTIPAELEPWSR